MSDLAGLLARIDRLVASVEAKDATTDERFDLLMDALDRNTAAMTAVAHSHAQLLAALLAPEEAPSSSSLDAELRRTIEESRVIG